MLKVALTAGARRQIARALARSHQRFGTLARVCYEALIEQAVVDLASNPARPGVRSLDDFIHYPIRHSRRNVPDPPGRVGDPRHILIARVAGDTLNVLALAHDSMGEASLRRFRSRRI